ncbi:hypothetical protein [Streptomyces gobiensis]|uniref:hypothetical protein n=1 Tax=Streptomyces gobiensis TaxID=2875706 RepID=UPI001E43234B|nr:hypothetical protein [Streptomyces gobiensis]UGY91262.1 hypothetical protein test1122_05710 [Streptomyces gobiensis]
MSRRAWISATLVLTTEGVLYVGYARYGAQFHFWLHGLFGGALGLAALTIVRIATSRSGPGRASPWESGFLGHIYSALPDLLFLGFGVLHVLWMDLFAFHITLHFIPAPLYTMLAVFVLTLAAYGLAMICRPWSAAAVLAAAAAVVVIALAFAAPIPHSVQQIRDHPGLSLLCPVPTHR